MQAIQQLRRVAVGTLLSVGLCLPLSAQALSITPATTPVWTTNDNSQLTAAQVATLVGYSGTLALVYKADQGSGDSGNAAGLYSTFFDVTPTDPSMATITWDSTTQFIDCPTCYLVVKDGSQIPAQYAFDISAWDGQESIVLSGFWPAQGAISNIAIYNLPSDGGGMIVPEANTYAMLLAGLGLVGFAARRKLS